MIREIGEGFQHAIIINEQTDRRDAVVTQGKRKAHGPGWGGEGKKEEGQEGRSMGGWGV